MEVWNISAFAAGFVLVVTSLILLYLFVDWKYKYWQRLGVKSPTLYEAITNIPKGYSQPVHVTIEEAYNKYGRLFGIYGLMPQLFVAEPEILKQIFVKDFHIFRNRLKFDFKQELLQKMLSILCDEDWKRVRCTMSPTFSSSKMRKMAILVNECSRNTTKFLQGLTEKNEVDVKPYFGSFAMDVIATTAFATKMNSLEDPNNEFLVNAREFGNRNISQIKAMFVLFLPRIAKLLKIEMFPMKPLNYFRDIVMKIIEEREKTKVKGYDFLQLMMDAKDGTIEAPGDEESKEAGDQSQIEERPKHKTISYDEIVSQCVMFFNAGHDTTATTMSIVAYNLAMNPDCQDRLAKEIQEIWKKHGAVDYDTVSKMPYLDAVINESLRKQSTALMTIRMCSENNYELGDTGVTVPKDTMITVPIYAMHNDPEWFPNPDKFEPERFMPENKHLIKPFTFMPFGEGPRNCIAMRFITMVMKLCFAHILKDIRFVATEETRKPLEYYTGQGLLQPKRIPLKVEKR